MVRAMVLGLALAGGVLAAGCAAGDAAEHASHRAGERRGRLSAEEMLNQMLQPTTQTAAPLQPVADGGGGVVNHNTINAVAPARRNRTCCRRGRW